MTFASGGGACCFETIATSHAAYSALNLAEPVYDGEAVRRDDGYYYVSLYSGGASCCYDSLESALHAYPDALLRAQ